MILITIITIKLIVNCIITFQACTSGWNKKWLELKYFHSSFHFLNTIIYANESIKCILTRTYLDMHYVRRMRKMVNTSFKNFYTLTIEAGICFGHFFKCVFYVPVLTARRPGNLSAASSCIQSLRSITCVVKS